VLYAAGEPKRGPLSCLLCPSTRALGAKRPKPDIIYLKNIKIFRPVDPKKNIFFNLEFLKILCFIHINSSIAPWVLRLYPKSVQIATSYGQIHTFHLPTTRTGWMGHKADDRCAQFFAPNNFTAQYVLLRAHVRCPHSFPCSKYLNLSFERTFDVWRLVRHSTRRVAPYASSSTFTPYKSQEAGKLSSA